MNLAEILIWQSSNLLLLIPVVIGLVMLLRWFQERMVFMGRDWVLHFGYPRESLQAVSPGSGSLSYFRRGVVD